MHVSVWPPLNLIRREPLADLPRPGSAGADPTCFEVECRNRGLEWPTPVVQQFLFDHGNQDEFIDQYDHIDLLGIHWQLVALPASSLVESTHHCDFACHIS